MEPNAPSATAGLDWLDPLERLAVAYAPRARRADWIGLLALDRRLADAAQEGRDPIMVQLRLAWWRDRFAQPATEWPKGEPLLALLTMWDDDRAALAALVDGWEARNVGQDGGAELASARIEAFATLARRSGIEPDDDLRRAVAEWLGHAPAGKNPRIPKAMRPLAILRGMALRQETTPLRNMLAALRLGLLGR